MSASQGQEPTEGALLAGRLTRRRFLRGVAVSTIAIGGSAVLTACVPPPSSPSPGAHASDPTKTLPDDQALQRLLDGNKRFVAAQASRPNQTAERRTALATGQHPFAVILGCSDSRVPPEILFDQGIGDLFTIRVAGNIADDAVEGSIEYAVEHLGVHLVVVLGHERCGAVAAAVGAVLQDEKSPGHIGAFVAPIRPAVEKAQASPGDLVDNAVRANVGIVVGQLKASEPILAELASKGELKIVGARYDLDSGAVEVIG